MAPRLANESLPLANTGRAPVRRWWVLAFAAGAVLIATIGLISVINTNPRFVSHVSFVNKSPYDLSIDVTDSRGDGWTGLTIARARASTDVSEVVDQGSTWTFHFSGQGVDGGDVTVSRATLAQSDWQVTIPTAVSERLGEAGAPPSPSTSTNR